MTAREIQPTVASSAPPGPRVMILSADYAPGAWSGIGVAVAHQATALALIGVDVHVVLASDRPPPPGGFRGCVPVHTLEPSRFPLDPRDFDWVHVHSTKLGELGLELRNRFGLRLAVTVHGWPHCELGASAAGRTWSRALHRLVEASDHVVFVSRAERDLGVRLVPRISGRCSTIGAGLPAIPARTTRGRRGGPIVFAGRFARSKGLDLLAEIIPRVLARRDVPFVIAGGHGDATGAAAVLQIRSRFPDRCRAPGWLDQARLHALYSRAAMVLVPSAYEPFGLVALEALRAGAPVLAADVGGLRDIVREGSGGRRIASRDPEVWAQSILDLLDDEVTAAGLSHRRQAFAAQHFSSEAAARRLAGEVYCRGVVPRRAADARGFGFVRG